jgi:Tol biopolymer transport system component
MILTFIAIAAASATCPLTLVAGRPNENLVMYDGVSPDGRLLAIGWDRGSAPNIQRGAYLLNLNTRERTDLPELNNAPSFSPDGRHLVSANYTGDRGLKTEIVELDRRTGQTRTFASARSLEWLASYSADGSSILFNSTRTGASDLYSVRRSDGSLVQLTDDPRYEAHASFFDHDRKLLFHRQTDGDNYDVVIRDLRTGAERVVGATPAEESYPALSPDARWIAFSAVAKAGAQPNLYLMRSDGTGRRRLTTGESKDAYATWAPDGRSLYFVRFDADGSKIYRLRMGEGHCRR